MGLFSWMQPKKKVLFLISLPHLPEFDACRGLVDSYLIQIRKTGADVYEEINEENLKLALKYDIIIVVAHHSDDKDSLLLGDGEMMINDFVSYFPAGFKGVLDFSSCYSQYAVDRIKGKCPNCKVQSTGSQASLILRMYLYPKVIDYIVRNKKADYHETFKTALKEALKKAEERNSNPNNQDSNKQVESPVNQMLGTGAVSVYAPKSVKREVPFQIQVICAKEADSRKVKLMATKVDSKAREVHYIDLPDMDTGDQFGVSISIIGKYAHFVEIEGKPSKVITIKDGPSTIYFCLTVDEQFPKDEITCKLLIEHKCKPLGDYYVTIKIKDESKIPAEVSFIPKNIEEEQQKAKERLIDKLELKRYKLKEEIDSTSDSIKRERLKSKLRACEKCIEIICNPRIGLKRQSKHVFVSSTSDLEYFRGIVDKAIKDCSLEPEMYETWTQTSLSPGEECCRRVMTSGSIVCILGSRYGSMEDSLDMSMTELEFRTAEVAGIPIMVFVIDPLNATDESPEYVERQNAFLHDLGHARVIKYFNNEKILFEDTKKNLQSLF